MFVSAEQIEGQAEELTVAEGNVELRKTGSLILAVRLTYRMLDDEIEAFGSVRVLQDGHLGGAGVDVTYVEPLPVESPLWELPNVIITPHVGAQAASRVDDSTRLAVENLARYFRGEQLLNEVDKKLGFPHPDVMAVNQ